MLSLVWAWSKEFQSQRQRGGPIWLDEVYHRSGKAWRLDPFTEEDRISLVNSVEP